MSIEYSSSRHNMILRTQVAQTFAMTYRWRKNFKITTKYFNKSKFFNQAHFHLQENEIILQYYPS